MKFATRKEQRKVTETINAIILPLIPHLKKDEADAVQTAITILQEVELESEGEKYRKIALELLDKYIGVQELISLEWAVDDNGKHCARVELGKEVDKYLKRLNAEDYKEEMLDGRCIFRKY